MKAQAKTFIFTTDTCYDPTIEYFGTFQLAEKARNEFYRDTWANNMDTELDPDQELTADQIEKLEHEGIHKVFLYSANIEELWLDVQVETKYMLFNWETVKHAPQDLTELTDQQFEELCKNDESGFIFNDIESFESAFNAELFSTVTHQLRIIHY